MKKKKKNASRIKCHERISILLNIVFIVIVFLRLDVISSNGMILSNNQHRDDISSFRWDALICEDDMRRKSTWLDYLHWSGFPLTIIEPNQQRTSLNGKYSHLRVHGRSIRQLYHSAWVKVLIKQSVLCLHQRYRMILLIINLLSGYVCMYAWYIYRCYGFFQWLGIDGPRSIFFFGNVWSFVRSKRVSLSIRNWTHEFGRVYGCSEGHAPIIVISDSDLLDEISVNIFLHFILADNSLW